MPFLFQDALRSTNGNVQTQKQPSTFVVYEDHEDESNKRETRETRAKNKANKESPKKKFKDNLSSVSLRFDKRKNIVFVRWKSGFESSLC